jgi:hypothetical protein
LKLGEEYEEVHLWLDELARCFPVWAHGPYHRGFRHNREGVEEVRKRWGNGAARAAELHIIMDMGYIPEPKKDAFKDMLEAADEEERINKK